MARQTPIGAHAPVVSSISDDLSSGTPSGSKTLIVLGVVLGFIVLGFLFYQTVGF